MIDQVDISIAVFAFEIPPNHRLPDLFLIYTPDVLNYILNNQSCRTLSANR